MQVIKKYSEALQQNVEVTVIGNGRYTARTEDGTVYTAPELECFRGRKVPKQIHILKKVFSGTVQNEE